MENKLECTRNCHTVFHHTGGRHTVDCALYPVDVACDSLDHIKLLVTSQKIDPEEVEEMCSKIIVKYLKREIINE